MPTWVESVLKFGELGLLALVLLKTSAEVTAALKGVEAVLHEIKGYIEMKED
jgi:hypothetical protein